MPLSATLEKIRTSLDAGDADRAIRLRKDVLKQIGEARTGTPLECFARAQAADLYLVMFDRDAAAALLEPYLGHAETAEEPFPELGQTRRAAMLSACGSTLYHFRKFDHAHRLIHKARELFEGMASDQPYVALGHAWTLAYAARIAWRHTAQSDVACKDLQHCLNVIDERRKLPGLRATRLVSLEAFVLDLLAYIRWRRGDLERALATAYRAVFLLSGHPVSVKETARRGHALLTAGRIQSTLSTADDYRDACNLLLEAEETLKPIRHPLRHLARLEHARVRIRSGNTTFAKQLLKDADTPKDDDFLMAERELTECWVANRESRWEEQRDKARNIGRRAAKGMLPRHLKLEGQLQLGVALSRIASASPEPIEVLEKTAQEAAHLGRERLHAASLLELALAHRRQNNRETAQRCFRKAREVVTHVSSPYLEKLVEEVRREVGRDSGWLHHVTILDDARTAVTAFRRAYGEHALEEHGGDADKAAEAINLRKRAFDRFLGLTKKKTSVAEADSTNVSNATPRKDSERPLESSPRKGRRPTR